MCFFPPFLVFMNYQSTPETVSLLWRTNVGLLTLGACTVWGAVGALLMRRIARSISDARPFIEALLAGVLAAGAVLGVAAAMDNGGQRAEIIESVIKDRPGQRGSRARKARQVISGQLAAALVQRFKPGALAPFGRLSREARARWETSENAFAFFALSKLITPFVVGGITAFCLLRARFNRLGLIGETSVRSGRSGGRYRLPDRWLDADIEKRKKEILRHGQMRSTCW